jgi:hypothetical protein
MKKFIITIFRICLRLFLVFCAAILILLIIFFSFPEKTSEKIVETFMPETRCSVGNIAWRKYGADFYDLKIIVPGTTADFHRISLKIKKTKYFIFDVIAYDGKIAYTPVEYKTKKRKPSKREPSYFDDNPVKFFFHANNIAFNTSYGVTGKLDAEIAGWLPNMLLEKFECKIDASGEKINFGDKISAENIHAKLDLLLKKPFALDYKPKDYILFYLNAFTGKIECKSTFVKTDKISFDDFYLDGKLKLGKIALDNTGMDVLGGNVKLNAEISRRKVRGKNKWKFKYDVKLCVTNLDAMEFCNTFNFNNNKLGGRFSGCVKTMVFGKSVKSLDGELQSDNPGVLYFPEAEKYIAGMQESMQKQIFDMMVERLKIYPYKFSIISLKYDLSKKNTEINFEFSGADEYKFNLIYNRSWIDAINLAKKMM